MAQANLKAMLEKFGVVTVMDVKLYPAKRFGKNMSSSDATSYDVGEWDAVSTFSETNAANVINLNSLKITNLNMEGPSKEAKGGMANDTLIKYGKTVTMEMQDALGRYDVLTELYGARASKKEHILAITDRFPGEKTLVGTTFFVDQETGVKQPLHVIVPIFLGDGIFNLSQDAEGDISTFDMNGSVARYESESTGAVGEDGKYTDGGDNSFYFLCTKDALTEIKTNGYRAAFEAEATTGDGE